MMSQEAATRVQEMARRVALERAIARKSDEYDGRARAHAEKLVQTDLDKTQVRGLETLAYTTDRVSHVFDWLKVRIGRDEKRKRWAKGGIGNKLLIKLEELRDDAQDLAIQVRESHPLPEKGNDLERQVHLRLIREYLKHLAAHFEYEYEKRRRENE
jgi:hypothetical protein